MNSRMYHMALDLSWTMYIAGLAFTQLLRTKILLCRPETINRQHNNPRTKLQGNGTNNAICICCVSIGANIYTDSLVNHESQPCPCGAT